jgi:hypothetical protein
LHWPREQAKRAEKKELSAWTQKSDVTAVTNASVLGALNGTFHPLLTAEVLACLYL